MYRPLRSALLSLLLVPFAWAVTASADDGGIAWQFLDKGDATGAFARAKAENKPLFLYWGAAWCPPCNLVKATVFNRPDFIESSKGFVPVYLDGDKPGAQRLAAQFRVRGYPTTIVFAPDGREITRLPGEVEPARYLRLLSLGLKATRPVKQLLAMALGGDELTADDWDLLAYYAWDTDEQQVLDAPLRAVTLQKLAQRAATAHPDVAARLQLKALAFAAGQADDRKRAANESEQAVAYAQLTRLLADPVAVRTHIDVLSADPAELVRYATATGSTRRSSLLAGYERALQTALLDTATSHNDRLNAALALVLLAKTDQAKSRPPTLTPTLLAQVRQAVRAADAQTADRLTRQAIMPTAAAALTEAGLIDESNALLKSELAKAVAPSYYLSLLSSNARARGDKAATVRWSEQAYTAAVGPATRLQWGSAYVRTLISQTPQDLPAVATAVRRVLKDIEPTADTFYERNQRSLEKMGEALVGWGSAAPRRATLGALQGDLARVCGQLPKADAATDACRKLFRPSAVS